jgi:hypothetical protein
MILSLQKRAAIKLTTPYLEQMRGPPGGACRSSFGAQGQRVLIEAPVARTARAQALHLIGGPLPGEQASTHICGKYPESA